MIRRALVAFLGIAALGGCESSTDLRPDAALSIHIVFDGVSSMADNGTLHIEGPSTRTVSIQPGQTVTVDNLQPGTYTVALEAFAGNDLESFAETTVTVSAGQAARTTLNPSSFVPSSVTLAPQVVAGQSISIQISPVTGATNYQVQWDDNPAFSSPSSTDVSGTTATITFSTAGQYYVRARARNRYGSLSLPSSPATTDAIAPPVITRYEPVFMPVTGGCPVGLRGFRTDETLDYTDADGNVSTSSTRTEPSGIESQWRFQGQSSWSDFYSGKSWSFVAASTPSSGTLNDVSTTCWRMPTSTETYVDFRVRLADSNGDFSDWYETRVMLPAMVTLEPNFQVTVGSTQQFTAEARDANGQLVAGNPVNWSVYTGSNFASITESGFYSVQSGAQGVDRVFARAGAAFDHTGIEGPSAGFPDSWWAPCWTVPVSNALVGTYRYLRMTVYANREYQVTLNETNSGSGTGDPDLYIRLGIKPTTATSDVASEASSFVETITWTAPSDGVLWIGIYTFAAYQGVTFTVTATDGNCGFPGSETLATAPPPGSAEMGPGPAPEPIAPRVFRAPDSEMQWFTSDPGGLNVISLTAQSRGRGH